MLQILSLLKKITWFPMSWPSLICSKKSQPSSSPSWLFFQNNLKNTALVGPNFISTAGTLVVVPVIHLFFRLQYPSIDQFCNNTADFYQILKEHSIWSPNPTDCILYQTSKSDGGKSYPFLPTAKLDHWADHLRTCENIRLGNKKFHFQHRKKIFIFRQKII